MEFVTKRDRNMRGVGRILAPLALLVVVCLYGFKAENINSENTVDMETTLEGHVVQAEILMSECLAIEKDIILRMKPNYLVQLDKNVAALSAEAQVIKKLAKQTGNVDAVQTAMEFIVCTEDYSKWLEELARTLEAKGINIKSMLQKDIKKVAFNQNPHG